MDSSVTTPNESSSVSLRTRKKSKWTKYHVSAFCLTFIRCFSFLYIYMLFCADHIDKFLHLILFTFTEKNMQATSGELFMKDIYSHLKYLKFLWDENSLFCYIFRYIVHKLRFLFCIFALYRIDFPKSLLLFYLYIIYVVVQ